MHFPDSLKSMLERKGKGQGKERTMSAKARERKRKWRWTGRNAICEYAFSMPSKKHIGKESKEKERNAFYECA